MNKHRLHRFQKQITQIIILVVGFWLLSTSLSYAAVPHLINYQGRLTDSSGKPVADGAYSVTFRIYDAESAGNLLWQETQSVTIQKGLFSVLLGSVTNLDLPFDKPYFLEIKVGEEVMSPRQQITSAGYAIRAEQAENANTVANTGVSTTPTANSLLVMDNNGRLPAGPSLLRNNIAILTGTISNGGTIPLPDGYTQAQCKWMVSPKDARTPTESHEVDFFGCDCYASADRVVTCFYRTRGSGNVSANANYMIIGIK